MKFFLLSCLLMLALSSIGQVLNFQTATPSYQDRELSHTFTNVGSPAVDVSISISGASSFGNNTPRAAGTGLTNQPNFPNNTGVETWTFTFSKPVQNLYFNLTNIDQGNAGSNASTFYQDKFTIDGTDENNAGITPGISSNPNYTVAGNVIIASSATNSTAAITFSGYVKTVTIVFGNGPAAGTNPSAQGFTVGTMHWGIVLPVDLTYFQAKTTGSAVNLLWETAWERNTDRFLVQRSRDLGEWTEVGSLLAKGDTESRNAYIFTDEQPLEGLSYYRLHQLDRDGRQAVAKPIAVRIDSNRPAVSLVPNPSNGEFIGLHFVRMTNPLARVYSLMGIPIAGQLVRQTEATAIWQPSQPLPTGVYLLELTEGTLRQVLTVVVQ